MDEVPSGPLQIRPESVTRSSAPLLLLPLRSSGVFRRIAFLR
jgi:hypothetical protein